MGYTDQYGPSSCDQQPDFYGFTTLDGQALPVPYTLIDSPDPMVYVLVNLDIAESSVIYPCNAPHHASYGPFPLFSWAVTPTLSFFSDPFATTPLNVTGLNLKVRYSGNNPVYYTPILSGVATTLPTVYSNQTPFEAQSECYPEGGIIIPDWVSGTFETPPYTLLTSAPSAPFVSLSSSGPTGAYTGSNIDINWNVSYATAACISTNFTVGSSTGNFTGTQSVTINGNTTYTLSCTNPLGTTTESLEIIDLGPPPAVNYCWASPGWSQSCPEPSICVDDPVNPGYQSCMFN
jgi:hypothetical protein